MAKLFVTGSADGLGLLAAQKLVELGHEVMLHARNEQRAMEAKKAVPGAAGVLAGDLASIEETKKLATSANAFGTFDAVIHNAGVYRAPGEMIFAVNTLAPYILTCLMHKPKRLIYLTSGMHKSGHALHLETQFKNKNTSYSDSKLHVVLLSMAVARKWPDVFSNTVNPGWVPTKMGGNYAPDDLHKGFETQVWLAVSDDPGAKASGQYFFHRKPHSYSPEADDINIQESFLAHCEEICGVPFPI